MNACRRAVTLIQVVVVFAISGTLMAIGLPAIQVSRERARNVQCQNRLRQVVMATHSFHNSHQSLPSLYNGTSLAYPLEQWDLFHTHSWRAELLPHLGQYQLRQKIDWNALATAKVNEPISQSVVPTFICPSGPDPTGDFGWGLHHNQLNVPQDNIPESAKYYVARSDYDALCGAQVLPDPLPTGKSPFDVEYIRWGIWGWPVFENDEIESGRLIRYRPGKFRDIGGGLTHTIAVVERGGKPTAMQNGKPNVTDDDPSATYPGQVGWSASNTFTWSLNKWNTGVNESNVHGVYSLHPSGANVSMADGSVRLLSDSTSFEVLVKMFSRTGGPKS